jgi:membrane protein DedA with SNARE-associated domain
VVACQARGPEESSPAGTRGAGGPGLQIERIVDEVAQLGSPWLYLLAFVLALGETAIMADLVVPGEVGMILAGAVAAAHPDVELLPMIGLGIVGATLGDTFGYVIGRVWGWDAICRSQWSRRLLGPKAAQARRYFEHRGGAAIFFGRWIGALRAVVAVVAGMGHMPYGRFLVWNVLASISWVTTAILVGYLVGPHVTGTVDRVSSAVAVVVMVAVAAAGVHRVRKVRREPIRPIPECVDRGRGIHDGRQPAVAAART